MKRRDCYDIHAVLAANGAKLEARRAIERARIAYERAERERLEAEWQAKRDSEWAAECAADRQRGADVLPWRKGTA